jgi:hypothetical protein
MAGLKPARATPGRHSRFLLLREHKKVPFQDLYLVLLAKAPLELVEGPWA